MALASEEANLGAWTTAPYNRIEEVPGTFFGPGYKVTCTFGVFETTATLTMQRSGNAAVIDHLRLHIDGLKWYYYSVSSPFSLSDLAFSGVDDLVDGAGDLCSTLVDFGVGDSSFFKYLEIDVGGGGCGGQTMVRVDRVAVFEGATPVWDSYQRLDQRYSTDSPLCYAIGEDVSDVTDVVIKVYVKVSDNNYNTGPLFLRDKIRFEWKWDGAGFKLQTPVFNPADYPTFTF